LDNMVPWAPSGWERIWKERIDWVVKQPEKKMRKRG